MPLKRLETLDSVVVHRNLYWEYRLDHYTLPDGGSGEYHYIHSPGSVMVVPMSDHGSIVMVKQFRYLWKEVSVEFPAGGVKNSNFLLTARNELSEEAQLAAKSWKEIGKFNPFNGVTNEVCRVYLAAGLTPSAGNKDASEEFEILNLTPKMLDTMITSGEIWDGMTIASWFIARKYVVEYFRVAGG